MEFIRGIRDIDEVDCPKCGSRDHWEQELGSYLHDEDGTYYNIYKCRRWIATEDGYEDLCAEKIYFKERLQ
jgi:hypothetical protein